MKLNRLTGRKSSDHLLRRGNVFKGKTMMIRWLPNLPKNKSGENAAEGLYVGTFASAKLHKSAVKRNRMRRRIREALRTEVKEREKIATAQLLMSPRPASLDAPFVDVQTDIRNFLATLSSWQIKSPRPAFGTSSSSSPSSTSAANLRSATSSPKKESR